MTDKNPLAHYSGVLSQAVQESATANVPASGAAALSAYLQDCEQHSIVPDVGGAFASAFAAGFNLATSQAAPAQTAQQAPAEGFELWWEDHMPKAGQSEAWAAWVELHKAAPAAVAVPDEREAFERSYAAHAIEYAGLDDTLEAVQLRLEENRRDKDRYEHLHDSGAWVGWRLARAALAATPAAVEAPATERMMQLVDAWFSQMKSGNVISQGMARQRIVMFVDTLAATPAAAPVAHRVLRKNTITGEWTADGRYWDDGAPAAELVAETAKMDGQWRVECAYATPAAAAPVVLPETDVIINEVMDLVERYADAVASDMELQYEALEISIKSKLRALLAGVSAPAALAVEPVYTWTGTEADDAMILLGRMDDSLDRERIDQLEQIVPRLGARINALTAELAAPQAQADARDAERYRYLTQQLGDYCITDAMENTSGVYKAGAADSVIDAAIAAQTAQQGGA
ncbi:hypothetical protein F3J24_17990 [Comamonas sp. Tr-654]|uniref:hypothetical protein n=1 Tax=Comamonas sp. Tr-654 TaxID=2608341 RepID=UPI001421EAE5|nr:hypothetical protein [Comamonas sp. Tr-654]NIF85402.1 hypothetical protein [Comamonas sp. Tr-654]